MAPGEAVTTAQVVAWFDSGSRYPEPKAEAGQVFRLVRLVNALAAQAKIKPDFAPPGEVSILDRARLIQKALRDLQTELPWLIREYEREHASTFIYLKSSTLPAAGDVSLQTHALKQLCDALSETHKAMPYLFEPPRQGEKLTLWHIQMQALLPAIEEVWQSVGCKQLSVKKDGPLVRVLGKALMAINSKAPGANAIASAVRDYRERSKGQPPRRKRKRVGRK
jgi:hypothetical protein